MVRALRRDPGEAAQVRAVRRRRHAQRASAWATDQAVAQLIDLQLLATLDLTSEPEADDQLEHTYLARLLGARASAYGALVDEVHRTTQEVTP